MFKDQFCYLCDFEFAYVSLPCRIYVDKFINSSMKASGLGVFFVEYLFDNFISLMQKNVKLSISTGVSLSNILF